MSELPEIGDEEFVPFLSSLGVETYKKSFDWMLSEPNFAGVLKWLYNNLDQNNALTAREEYRYLELAQKGLLLSDDELESTLSSIKDTYPSICVPGDHDSKENVKLDIQFQFERLSMLEKHEGVVKDLIQQNELTKENLITDITKLHAAEQQCIEDESTAAQECTALAQELEKMTEAVVNVIADGIGVYAGCREDKEISKRFLTFSPLETYRQTQSLFRSHFDLFVSKNILGRQNDITDEDLRDALFAAQDMEERLTDATFAYIESKAELSGEQAKLSLVSNYNTVHSSQITNYMMECQSALELLEQEELIAEQQMNLAVEQMVKYRSNLAVNTAAAAALTIRQQITSALTHLVEVCHQALTLDKLLYYCLRHEHRLLEDFIQFATQLHQYLLTEDEAINSRIESMNLICAEQDSCAYKQNNILLQTLFTIFNAEPSDDASILVKLYNDLQANIRGLRDSVNECLRKKEDGLMDITAASLHIKKYIYDGCTKQPNCWDRSVASLTHLLKENIDGVDKRVVEASSMFTAVKTGDKHNLRKLWQYFLCDPARLQATLKLQIK